MYVTTELNLMIIMYVVSSQGRRIENILTTSSCSISLTTYTQLVKSFINKPRLNPKNGCNLSYPSTFVLANIVRFW